MEVSLIKETGDNIKGSDTVSMSSHSQMIVSGELHVANNEHETYQCDHFTIRGYVADVRKRDMKICWPLFKRDNHALEGHPDMVPPLSVKNFRDWNCQNCLHKTIAPENVVENGMLTDVPNYDEVQNNYRLLDANATTSSHRSPVKYVASLPQQCKEKCLKERTIEKDSFIHGSNGQCHSLLCLGQKDTKLQSSGSVKGGTKISGGGQDRSFEKQKQMSKETVVAAEEKAGNIVIGSNISGSTLLDKGTTSIMVSMRKDTELIHGIGDAPGKMLTSMGFKPAVSYKTDGQQILKSKGSSRNGVNDFSMKQRVDISARKRGALPEASDTNLDLVDTMVHSQDVVMKRTSSVDVQQHKRGPKLRSINEITGRGEIGRIGKFRVSSGDAETNNKHISRNISITSRDRVHLVTQNDEQEFRRKKDALTNEDGLLAHWVKEVSTKPKKRKRSAESNHSSTKVGRSESVALKDLDLNVEYCGEKDEEAIIGEEKQSMMADVIPSCSVLKNDELPGRGHTIFENSPTAKNDHSKLSEVRIFDKDLNHGIKTQENCGKVPLPNNQKNKRPRSEDGASLLTHWPKRQTGFKLYSKMERKPASEQNAEDGITPLAKQQNEKNLMNCVSDNGSMCNSLAMTENMKDVNMWGTGRACGSTVPEYIHRTTITNDGVVEHGLKNCQPSGLSKPNQYIDLNQEAPISTCTESQSLSRTISLPMGDGQFSFTDPNRARSPLNSSWNGTNVLALRSDQINRTAPGSRFGHNRSSVLLDRIPVTDFRKLGFRPEPVARDVGYQRQMVDLSRKSLCKGKSVSSTKTFAVPRGDSNANETISALNLMRLMHQAAAAACSPEHRKSPIHNDFMRSTQQSNSQRNGLLIPGVGVRSSEVSKLPIRPVARLGILGPHLQKEIASSSNNSRLSLGLQTNAMGKGEAYPVGAHVNNNKNGTFQPERSSQKMEECVVNRNPAEFAMPDDFDAYMVEYTEPKNRRKPQSRNLQSLPHQSGKKRRK